MEAATAFHCPCCLLVIIQSLFAPGKICTGKTLAGVALFNLHILPENIGEVDDKASFL
jgi:hypothetical protein